MSRRSLPSSFGVLLLGAGAVGVAVVLVVVPAADAQATGQPVGLPATGSATSTAAPPTANDDSASTTVGLGITIRVLKNDDANGGGPLHIRSVSDPGHGASDIDGPFAVYTPDRDFIGTDSFSYVAATQYGSDTATVTVRVIAPPVSPSSPGSTFGPSVTVTASAVDEGGESTSGVGEAGGRSTRSAPVPAPTRHKRRLAETGVTVRQIGEVGVGLMLLGGAVTALGRRRRTGNHA